MIEEEQTHRNFLRRDRENRCFMTFPNTTEAMKMGGGLSWGRASGKTGAGAGRDHGGLRPGWMAERSWREEMEKLAVLNGVTYEAVYEN